MEHRKLKAPAGPLQVSSIRRPIATGILALLAAACVPPGAQTPAPGQDQDDVQHTRKRAEQGDVWGQRELGALYLNGQGVPQDHQEAASGFARPPSGETLSLNPFWAACTKTAKGYPRTIKRP